MLIYHEIDKDSLNSVKVNGLKCQSRGVKSDDEAVRKTNAFLDDRRPSHVKAANVSRQRNLYGYLGNKSWIIDIKDGSHVAVREKRSQNNLVLLRLTVNQENCWISDLDIYDALKDAIMHRQSASVLAELAARYWQAIQPLLTYDQSVKRPEVLITRNIPPSNISQL